MTDIRRPEGYEVAKPARKRGQPHYRQKGGVKSLHRQPLRDGSGRPQNEDGIMIANATERDQLMSLLFKDGNHLDLKFFLAPARKEDCIADDICRELFSAIRQKDEGTATVTKDFGDDARKIDVRTLFRS